MAVAIAGVVCFALLVPAGPRAETFVDISPGMLSMQIAEQLREQGIIRSRYVFIGLHEWKGGTLKAGEYRFDHPAPMKEVLDRIHRGDVYTVALTVPEGSNLFDIAAKVEAAGLGLKAAFIQAARQDGSLVSNLDPTASSLEGYLFPDTYRFARHTDPQEMMAVMVKRFRQATQGIGLTADYHQTVTLASLVEKETPLDAEPAAGGQRLCESDGEEHAADDRSFGDLCGAARGRYRGTIYQSDLQADSPYNTYKHAGLPPGPICNPGLKSLQAAMHPARTDYLYFVAASADPSGQSRFSATLEEHAKDVEAYRRAVRGAGAAAMNAEPRDGGAASDGVRGVDSPSAALRWTHRTRTVMAVALTLALPAMNGCLWHTRRVPQATMPANVQTVPPEQLVDQINKQYDAIN